MFEAWKKLHTTLYYFVGSLHWEGFQFDTTHNVFDVNKIISIVHLHLLWETKLFPSKVDSQYAKRSILPNRSFDAFCKYVLPSSTYGMRINSSRSHWTCGVQYFYAVILDFVQLCLRCKHKMISLGNCWSPHLGWSKTCYLSCKFSLLATIATSLWCHIRIFGSIEHILQMEGSKGDELEKIT